jgi:arylsulfatase
VGLTLFFGACSQPDAQPIESEVGLTGRLGDLYTIGEVSMGTAAAGSLLESGWHRLDEPQAVATWTWAAAERASLLVPVEDTGATTLTLQAQAPKFLPFQFSVGVELNGQLLETFDLEAKPTTLTAEIPANLLLQGLNRVTLVSSHVESPQSQGAGDDARKLGVQVRTLGIGTATGQGRTLRIQIPASGLLQATSTGPILVQDATALTLVAQGAKSLHADLSKEAGREVYVSLFGDATELKMAGSWRPANLILIVVDTLRADIIKQVDTPHLDALAKEGVLFTNSFSHAPMTLPSHTALFSSRYPHSNGVVNNGQKVPQELPLLSDWMVRSGYQARAVASLGTLWLGSPRISLDRGFESFDHARGDDTIGAESVPLMKSVIAELAPDEPFFLFAHFADPHEPYRDAGVSPNPGTVTVDGVAFAEFEPRDGPHVNGRMELSKGTHRIVIESPGTPIEMRSLHVWPNGPWNGSLVTTFIEGGFSTPIERIVAEFTVEEAGAIDFEIFVADRPMPRDVPDRYRQEVKRADEAVGELIATLKDRGLWDQSLVVFTSDHGEALGENGRFGHVQTLFDDQIHVPLMIKPPAGAPWDDVRSTLKSRRKKVVRHIDLVPTVLDILNLQALPGQMGTSLMQDKPRMVLSETHKPEAPRDLYSCRDDQYKLIYAPAENVFVMFDIQADPGEQRDVFATKGNERLEWQELLRTVAHNWDTFGTIEVDASETDRLKAMGYL